MPPAHRPWLLLPLTHCGVLEQGPACCVKHRPGSTGVQEWIAGGPHRLCMRRGFWKAKMRAYSRGRPSLASQALVRQLFSPRYLAKRTRAATPAGVSTCARRGAHAQAPGTSVCACR